MKFNQKSNPNFVKIKKIKKIICPQVWLFLVHGLEDLKLGNFEKGSRSKVDSSIYSLKKVHITQQLLYMSLDNIEIDEGAH